jgi:two-component system sensor histidine kinase RegB
VDRGRRFGYEKPLTMRHFLDLFLEPATAPPMSGARISRRTLQLIRWAAVIGQALALVLVHFGLGFPLPLGPALAVVAASVVPNLVSLLRRDPGRRLGERGAAFYLGYDILQLAVLLFLTGGLQNPFAMLMLAPVTIAATILSQQSVLWLSGIAIGAIAFLAVVHLPLPWAGTPPEFPSAYILGVWAALTLSTAFIAAYTWSVSHAARRLRDAFGETQLALAREQRISAVGALAAAAAHELGSPLATIAVIAKELVRELPAESPYAEDAALLLSQSERCRTILAELAHRPEADRAMPFGKLPISALVEAAGANYRAEDVRVIYATASGATASGATASGATAGGATASGATAGGATASGATAGGATASSAMGSDSSGETEPLVPRSPEILHGLGNLIQNAIQFAQHEVTVTMFWDATTISIDVADDGLGFPPAVLARVGEPYISGRAGESGHMGLGIFIAQTLLERSGARLAFDNLPEGGGHVAIQWDRAKLEAGPRPAVEEREFAR